MKKVNVELSFDTIDAIVAEQLAYWADFYKLQAEGTATWYVHPQDKDASHAMYAALNHVLTNLFGHTWEALNVETNT